MESKIKKSQYHQNKENLNAYQKYFLTNLTFTDNNLPSPTFFEEKDKLLKPNLNVIIRIFLIIEIGITCVILYLSYSTLAQFNYSELFIFLDLILLFFILLRLFTIRIDLNASCYEVLFIFCEILFAGQNTRNLLRMLPMKLKPDSMCWILI